MNYFLSLERYFSVGLCAQQFALLTLPLISKFVSARFGPLHKDPQPDVTCNRRFFETASFL